jgi:type I restriction enzyme S subunit
LDRKTAAVDVLIAKKERLVELFQEKRQALITQAVTKGLDPNVPMKDSGVHWLGRIPASWTVLPLRRLLCGIEQGWSPEAEDRPADEGEWAVLKLSAVSKGRFRPEEQKALPSGTQPERRYEVRAGDLLLTRANTPLLVGDACYVDRAPPRLMLPDLIYRLGVRHDLAHPAYLARFLLSAPGRSQVMADARGSSMTMAKVSGSHIRSWLVSLPSSLEEQMAIVRALNARCGAIDDLQRKLTVHIEKLREYRQALIAAAVTGKIDVSKEAA